MAETVQLGSGSADQPGPGGVRPMTNAVVWLLSKLFTTTQMRRISKKLWYEAVRLDSQVKP